MHCLNCGTLAPADAAFCPQCGTALRSQQHSSPTLISLNGVAASFPFNGLQQDATSSTPPMPKIAPPTPPNVSPLTYGMPVYSPNSHSSSPSSSTSYHPSMYARVPSRNNSSLYSPTPLPAPARQPRHRFSRSLLLTILILVILLMFSSIGLIYYSTVIHTQQLQATAIVSFQHTMTASALSTATANAQAQATATAQIQSTASAQAQATAITLQNMYTQATTGTLTMSDSLSAQSATKWQTYNGMQGGGCAFIRGALHSNSPRGYYTPCIAPASNLGNFVIEVNVTLIKGDEAGLLLRLDKNTNKGYFFYLTSDGYYAFDAITGDNQGQLLVSQRSLAIHNGIGQSNILTVIARNSKFYLYINKQFVASAIDSTVSSGEIAVTSDSLDNDTEAAFSNLHVWHL